MRRRSETGLGAGEAATRSRPGGTEGRAGQPDTSCYPRVFRIPQVSRKLLLSQCDVYRRIRRLHLTALTHSTRLPVATRKMGIALPHQVRNRPRIELRARELAASGDELALELVRTTKRRPRCGVGSRSVNLGRLRTRSHGGGVCELRTRTSAIRLSSRKVKSRFINAALDDSAVSRT